MDNQDVSGLGAEQESTPKTLRNFGGRRQVAPAQVPPEKDFRALPEAVLPRVRRPVSDVMRLELASSTSSESPVPPFPPSAGPSCEYFPELPVAEPHQRGFSAYLKRKFGEFTKPNRSLKERIRALPLIGYLMAWGNAILKVGVTRHHHQLELANLREQNQMLRRDILAMHQRFNQLEPMLSGMQARGDKQFHFTYEHLEKIAARFDLSYYELRELHASIEEVFWCVYQGPNSLLSSMLSNVTARYEASVEKIALVNAELAAVKSRAKTLEELQPDARLRRLETIDASHRLMKLEQLEVARKLKQLNQQLRSKQKEECTLFGSETQDQLNLEALRERLNRIEQRLSSSNVTTKMDENPVIKSSNNAADHAVDLDQFYIEFEDKFRGSKQEIKQRLRAYLPYVDGFARNATQAARRFVDVGCGRGEWLELLGEIGIPALGIDMNAAMVDSCLAAGCAAKVDDAIAYLQKQDAGSLGGVTGFHIVEHLPFETLITLFDAAYAALAEGGLLIFETPNPENMIVGSCNFYFDPTHRNPIVPAVAEFIAKQRGFSKAEILRLHPFPESYRVKNEGFSGDIINQFFYGPQDYALIAWK